MTLNIKHTHRLVRFIVVGCLNTGFSYSLYAIFLLMGAHFTVANLLAFLISIVFSFKTQGVLVFRNADNRIFIKFILAWIVIYLINIALIKLLMSLGLNVFLAGLLALPPITLISYFMQSTVFRKTSGRAQSTNRCAS